MAYRRRTRRRIRRRVRRSTRGPRPARIIRRLRPQRFAQLVVPFKRVVPSKNFTIVTQAQSGTNAFSFSNQGFMTLTTQAQQSTQYFSVGIGFCLTDVPAATDLTLTFDMYKLIGIKFRVVPIANFAAVPVSGGTSNAGMGIMWHHVVDYDDATQVSASDAGIDDLRQYPSYKLRSGLQPWKRYIKPHIATSAYASGVFTSFANQKPMWIDCNSPDVQHYGIKFVGEVLNPDANVHYLNFRVEATYYLLLKDPR